MSYLKDLGKAISDLGVALAGKRASKLVAPHLFHDLRVLFPEHMREEARDGYLDLQAVPIALTELQRAGLFLLTQLDSALASKDRLDEVLANFERLSDQNLALDQSLAHAYRDLDVKEQYQKRLRLDIQDLEGQIEQFLLDIQDLQRQVEQHKQVLGQLITDADVASLDLATEKALHQQSLALIARYQARFGDLPDVESAQ